MEPRKGSLQRLFPLRGFIAFVSLTAFCGCTAKDHYVIASTGTIIGVDIAKDESQPAPHAKLGYNRAELAVVPTNRANCEWREATKDWSCAATQCSGNADCHGARDAADVLMELRYGGIFDTGKSSGIYQRLAVGSIAVQQPGASFMFARNDEGEITPAAAAAVSAAVAPDKWAESVMNASEVVAKKLAPSGTVDEGIAKTFFLCLKETDDASTRFSKRYAGLTSDKLRSKLQIEYPDELQVWATTSCAS
jgi:hypothetical protein